VSNSSYKRLIAGPTGDAELGEVGLTPAADVHAAVAVARQAQPAWGRLPACDRAALLDSAADLLAPREDELGELLAAESGKPLAQARFEVHASIGLMRANAEEARRVGGRVLPTEWLGGTAGDLAYTRREPLGVVAAILPFNFPVELYVEKVAAALAGGNAVVVKPPLEDPLVVMRFHDALHEAGVPEEVLVAVNGDRDVGAALASAPGVDAISLTGSTGAGLAVAEAGVQTLRTLHLELGGNNGALVLEDADLDLVAPEMVRGRLMMNGQACSASKRIIVHRSLHGELARRLVEAAEEQVVGPATSPETTIGPLITPQAAGRVAAQAQAAVGEGAELMAGQAEADGPWVSPIVLGGVPSSAAVASDDEIFGPVFTLIPVDSTAEAVSVANGSSFGLMASVFSADLSLAVAVAERISSGGVVVNGTDNYRPPNVPFHGVGLSGTGREGIGYTLEELTREKMIVLKDFRRQREDLDG
jgi:acyl-CoA reductase-like NAD-dependent aldehyde dehydrogenase